MIVILLVICGSWFDADDAPPVKPATPFSAACKCGCDKAGCSCSTAAKSSPRVIEAGPVVTLVVTPNCGYCDIQAARLKELGVKFQTRVETAANNRYAGYPVLELPGRTLHGLQPKEAIERWVKGAK